MLDISHDYYTGRTTVRMARLHRGTAERAVLNLTNMGVAAKLATGAVLKIVAKPKKKRDAPGGARLFFVTIEPADYHENSGTYRKTFSSLTDAINALFEVDEDDANDIDVLTVDANIVYIPDGGGEEPGDTFDLTIENTTYNADDASPESTETPDAEWVAHGHSQAISDEGKARARTNIGAAATGDFTEALEAAKDLDVAVKVEDWLLGTLVEETGQLLDFATGRRVLHVQQAVGVVPEVVCTLPVDEDYTIPLRRKVVLIQMGTSEVLIQRQAHSPEVLINGSAGPFRIRPGIGNAVTIYAYDSDTWVITGDFVDESGAIAGIVKIENDYATIRCPDGSLRYLALLNDPP